MLANEQVSQFKFIAKTLPNVVASDTTSSGVIASLTPGPSIENATPNASHGVVNSTHHFQAPEHAQKQAVMSQAIVSVPESAGQILPTSVAQATVVAGVPGQGVFYDGKRMRKTMQRRTVDYNSSITRYLEARKWFKCARNQYALQPQEIYNVDVVPPCGYVKNPINAVTTKFVRTSTNKLRCPIFCVVWTPEGRRLVTGASSGEFTLWNGLTFNFETILQAHDRAVRSMVWSHNDLWLLTGDHGGFIKYWQSNMNNVKMYEAHKEPVRGLSFSPSDNKFASCSDDGLVKVWDFYRCAEERELKGHGTDVKCVDWHPSKGLLVSGCKDSQKPVKLWDPRTGNNICTLHCHKSTVMTAKWNSNGNWLVTGSRDHLLKLFDIRTMKELQTFRGHKKEATVVAWHPVHETLFASGGSDGSLMFWLTGVDEKAGGMEKAHEGIVWSLSWHPLGHILCSGSNDHTSKFWARNRPGDSMTDKYNLDIQGTHEDTEYNDEGTTQTSSVPALAAYDASQVIPGVGIPVTASKVVLPDSKDVDVDLYGGQIKAPSSSPESSEFPYPPAMNAFKKPGYSIPGLDLTNSQTNPGFNNSFHAPPKLRLPSLTPRSSGSFNPPQGSYPMANHQDNNHFARGPRNGMEQFSPRGPDPNFRHPGPFLPNQHGRFPGPRGPRSGPWRFSPCPPGRNFEFHRPPNDHFMGGRPRNMPPFGFHRGPPPGFQKSPPELQGGQPPHEGPIRFRHESKPDGAMKNIAVHDGQRLNFSQGPRGNIQGGPRTRGPSDSVHMDTQQGGSVSNSPRVERVPGESNMGAGQLGSHEEGFRSRDKWQSDLNERSNDDLEKQLYESQNVSVNPARLNDGHHVGPRPHLNIRPGVHGPKGTPSETLGPLGPRGFINVSGPRGLRRGPLSPNEGQNSGRHLVTPRGSRTPPFQPPSSDQWQPELKSPEGDRPSEFKGRSSRKNSRDRSSRDSSPHRNQTKTDRQGSESDAPGILGDYQTHVQEMQRGLLENFASTAVGRLFAQPELGLSDIGRSDRSLNRSDKDNARPDDARGRARDWEKEKRSPREKSGDHDRRSELGRPREERPSHRERSRDRQVFDVRPNDRPVRGQPENLDGNDLPANEKPGLLPIPEAFVAMGPMESAGRDQVSSNHRQTERRRDSGRFQDGQNERKGFWRGPLQDRHTPDGQLPGGQVDEPSVMEDANVKPLMSLLDALPLGNAAAQGGFDNRRRKRSTEHDFDRPSKRVETNESRERMR